MGWTTDLMGGDMDTVTAAADRFFRCYARHCLDPDADTLFTYLNALHSFNDKLKKSKRGNMGRLIAS